MTMFRTSLIAALGLLVAGSITPASAGVTGVAKPSVALGDAASLHQITDRGSWIKPKSRGHHRYDHRDDRYYGHEGRGHDRKHYKKKKKRKYYKRGYRRGYDEGYYEGRGHSRFKRRHRRHRHDHYGRDYGFRGGLYFGDSYFGGSYFGGNRYRY